MNTLFRLISTMATAGLALAPFAAYANTRAGDSGAIYPVSIAAGSDYNAAINAEDNDDDNEFFIYLLAGSWVTGIIFIIFEDDNQSPGGN